MQCKDIPTRPILEFLAGLNGRWAVWYLYEGCTNSVQLAMPPDLPAPLILAKMRKLIRSGLLDGCPCGCRGDYVLTDKGRAYLNAP